MIDGDLKAVFAEYFLGEVDRERVFLALSKLSAKSAKALLLVGQMHRDGDGTIKSAAQYQRCISELVSRAELGFADAEFEMAMALLWGDNLPKDEEKGRRLLLTAAEAGNADAQFELASYSENGQFGFDLDKGNAHEFLLAAVRQDHPEALHRYAISLLEEGRKEEAIALLQRAASCHAKSKELLDTLRH